MKKISFLLAVLLFAGMAIHAQSQYDISTGPHGEKILKGILSRDLLEKDTAFSWYAENQKGYTPNETGLTALKNNADTLRLILFMGTWCEDSHFIIPRFFSLIDKAGFSSDRVTLIGVDRGKKTLGHLSEALHITNVPTIIVLKNGKELGRVIEYGSDGLFDKALGEVINTAK
ncbi:MAG: thioredoxin family protein [Chitinophagaceae bacterium]